MKNEKVISMAVIKAKQSKPPTLTTDKVLEAFHEVVMYPHVFIQGLVNELVPYVNKDFLDVDRLRGFLIDVINCIHDDNEILQEWITANSMDDSEDYMMSLFQAKPKTKNERLSDIAYSIITGARLSRNLATKFNQPGSGVANVIEFSASVLWIINGDYVHEKPIDIGDFISGAIIRNYDFEADFDETLDNSLFCLRAWFVLRMMSDIWHFAAIMADGDMVEFEHLNAVEDDKGLYAHIDAGSCVSVTDEDVQEYGRKVIANKQMSIQVKNIVLRNASDGSVWMDAKIIEGSAYNIYRTDVSINVKHVFRSHESTREKGVTILYFDIQSLRTPKKEYDGALRLCDVVMFFDIADT